MTRHKDTFTAILERRPRTRLISILKLQRTLSCSMQVPSEILEVHQKLMHFFLTIITLRNCRDNSIRAAVRPRLFCRTAGEQAPSLIRGSEIWWKELIRLHQNTNFLSFNLFCIYVFVFKNGINIKVESDWAAVYQWNKRWRKGVFCAIFVFEMSTLVWISSWSITNPTYMPTGSVKR